VVVSALTSTALVGSTKPGMGIGRPAGRWKVQSVAVV